MRKYVFILLLIIIPVLSFTTHKYYISLTKIEYKSNSKSLQITMRIFIDDLQEAISTSNSKNLELNINKESNKIDSLLNNYINAKLSIKIDNKPITYQFIGKEYENDLIFIYLESENINAFKTISVRNNMLIEMFPSQKNIVKININTVKKTFFLTKKKNTEVLTL